MINLTENIVYDTSKSFLEQNVDVQEYVKNKIENQTFDGKTEEPAGKFPRPLSYIWVFNGYRIIKSFNYEYPSNHPMNGIVKSEVINVTKN